MIKHFPRLTTIALSYVAVFVVFILIGPSLFSKIVTPLGLLGIFVAGMLYTYSFTTSIGALLLLPFALHYPAGVIAVIGGIGSVFADFTIFKIIRHDLNKEVQRIASSKVVHRLGRAPLFREAWFRDIVGALIIASPIPDEMGIAIMSNAKIEDASFALLAFIADMFGIYVLVSAVALIY